ncbi:Endonuclease/Exonuclease/phosphatase family protein [Prevotella sp. ne3005]|uniref:endonuclease/exonuclease/phosphatase family protein n=1 Tax=Prevotella sp. ne3005 TaxID=1761887 RepID=UPI0008AB054E|nr:endonuclease/exonuclease/phosphatase family protein [Prevotella sp. ne3005]SEM54224.1 Endonuclease/Exonuclease/phosphatase family protein [Prevotella sp. ne3005]
MKKLILIVPLLIMVLFVVAMFLLLLGLWQWAVSFVLVVLILNWWSETFALHPFGEINSHYDFRILSFNVNRAHGFSVNMGTTEQLIEFILKQNADIVLLQEYNAELYPEVQERLNYEYSHNSVIEINSRFKTVFSRFSIESCEQLMVDSNDPKYKLFQNAFYNKKNHKGIEVLPICKMKIMIAGRMVQVFNCHLMSNNYSVVIRNLRKKGQCICYGIIPILKRLDFGYKARTLQARILSEHIDENLPALICGDFNDVSGSATLHELQQSGLYDSWWKKGFGFGYTFHGMGLRFRLDHVLFTSKQFKLCNIIVPRTNVSDHSPTICDFVFLIK